MKKFAFIAEGEVFIIWALENKEDGINDRMIAGFQSNPIIVEIPEDSDITEGWTYDSFGFHAPGSHTDLINP